jgi:hypothetical protein
MTTATENLFTATVYDVFGEDVDTITGTDIIELERRVWSLWGGSDWGVAYTISDDLGAELVCESLD